jgi:hypothetical protein
MWYVKGLFFIIDISLLKSIGSLIVNFDLIIPDNLETKVLVVDTVYKLVRGLISISYSGEVVNVTSATLQHSSNSASKQML